MWTPVAGQHWDDAAEKIHGLRRERLEREGVAPREAMAQFAASTETQADGRQPIFVGFNAPFDWMFVADYFWRYLGRNPFGISALDLKSFYMARERLGRWELTRRQYIDERLGIDAEHNHHALDDARGQARLARVLLGSDRS